MVLKDLKYPPTAVGGIKFNWEGSSRKDLNEPPTAVGGIQRTTTACAGSLHELKRSMWIGFDFLQTFRCYGRWKSAAVQFLQFVCGLMTTSAN